MTAYTHPEWEDEPMSDEPMSAEDLARAAGTLRELLAQVDAGQVDAGQVGRAHIAGALAALDELLTEDHP